METGDEASLHPLKEARGHPYPHSRGVRESVSNLERIKNELLAQLRSDSKFSFVNTRVILRTGVNLREYTLEEAHDPVVVARVLKALGEQGFTFHGG
ncbi:MAG TPA: hypothetical protein VGM06_03435 [Polyangiaceae bacterium]|jgi:hypothetical protein